MPILNGPKVRHRAAARGWDLVTLSQQAGIPTRAVQNCTRLQRPQPMHLTRIYALGRALAAPGEDPNAVAAELVNDPAVAAEIVASGPQPADAPTAAKDEPKREPTGPTRRQETEKTTGPKRAEAAA
ncbi:hypothetical protein [Amycolatopsis solani]|uniref:hypothetical protein n=1 Tax=Amycolatopsis solani TaxID=3028615 RepID=UPI0025B12E3B|nr:hypothetical protein [Amycolatopsis sp. MEP2-6]